MHFDIIQELQRQESLTPTDLAKRIARKRGEKPDRSTVSEALSSLGENNLGMVRYEKKGQNRRYYFTNDGKIGVTFATETMKEVRPEFVPYPMFEYYSFPKTVKEWVTESHQLIKKKLKEKPKNDEELKYTPNENDLIDILMRKALEEEVELAPVDKCKPHKTSPEIPEIVQNNTNYVGNLSTYTIEEASENKLIRRDLAILGVFGPMLLHIS